MQRPPPPIDYRLPVTGSHRVQRVLGELAADEKLGAASIALKLLLGVPLCLVGPFLVTVILKYVELRGSGDWLPGFRSTFLLSAAVLVPLLLLLEIRSRGGFFSDSLQGETSPFTASSYGEFRLQSAKLAGLSFIEIALTGPRLVLEAAQALLGYKPVDLPLRVAAAEIAVELFDAGEGMPVRQLARPHRPPAVVWRAVSYLARREWVGISSRRDRVWLATPARKRLGRL